ncbi:neuraminidase-like domain-containing protein [Planococcus shenhongbingii]|uniref:Tc toxin subunit A-related protein n=1 Tax=Planococcus shenhongbingii TaxID=3058398 RepID=UPI0026068B6E|nr:neuraminidase-like domain-containing protein [Planococcus sp. N016]WKA60353.1 neuraminidase-like domain-containing protein [Planococcus sp. N016]
MPNKDLNNLTSKLNLFKFDLKEESQQKLFEEKFKKNNGDWSALKSELNKEAIFTPEIINDLEFTHHLTNWSEDDENLVSAFQKDEKIKSLRDIATSFNKPAFIEKLKGFAKEGVKEEEQENYAINLHRDLFKIEPTALVINMIKDQQVPILNDNLGSEIQSVLEKRPDFNIKNHSIYELIKDKEALQEIPADHQEPLIANLKILQRITAISPDADAVPALYNANLHSAIQISNIPQSEFMAVMKKSGLDDGTLSIIYTNAQQTRVRNEQAIMTLREIYKGTGIDMIDKSMALNPAQLEKVLPKHDISWDLLFNDANFCECEECSSVYSAAAYYVELLQYLRNNNLDAGSNNPIPIKPNAKDITGTPLEKLFNRRPDLGYLELTCKNTNTVLPYIDLVNEVMENYVAYKKPRPFNVKDEESGELLAEPRHTEYQAYETLKGEVYPFTLPYHQAMDSKRIYLRNLDTSRYELLRNFRKNDSADEEVAKLKDEALNRSIDAEFLGLTKEEYVILTKESFENKSLIGKLKAKDYTDEQYRDLIGVKPTWEYYGYKDKSAMLGDKGLSLIKEEFLHRTGIDYINLVELLKANYINPYKLKGKAKVIMESLHVNYRFLQYYSNKHGIDKMAEELSKNGNLSVLTPKQSELLDFPIIKETTNGSNSGQVEMSISKEDIVLWVKDHFEKLGKVIVIEDGRDYANGKINKLAGDGTENIGSIEDAKLFFDAADGKIEVGSIDRTSGKVALKDAQIPTELSNLEDLFFIDEKGGKGIFVVDESEIHLIFLQQKETCDLDSALLMHLDGTSLTIEEYDRIHRFIRLWRKLDWTIDKIDNACATFSEINNTSNSTSGDILSANEKDISVQNCDINPHLLHQLTAVKKLLDKTGLELNNLLPLWGNISTNGEKPLYHQLFLTYNVLGIDKIFKEDDNGELLASDAELLNHIPAVMAALNLSADDIYRIMQDTEMKNRLTLQNLSTLYRHRLLSKLVEMRIPAFLQTLKLHGDVFQDALATLKFLENFDKIEASGFSFEQLNYICENQEYKEHPLVPTQNDLLQLSKTLYDGLNLIDATYGDLKTVETNESLLEDADVQEQATTELVRTKISLLFEPESVEKIIGLLEGTNIFIANAAQKLKVKLPKVSSLKSKLKYDEDHGTVQITGILTQPELDEYRSVNKKTEWIGALDDIQRQQYRLFHELLSGLFNDDKKELEEIIKSGDISIPLDKIKAGEKDVNTAPQKRAAFLAVFMPYLRQQLARRFIVATLAEFLELDAKITDVLISEIIRSRATSMPIYDIFEDLKESGETGENNWSGFIIPQTNAKYTFIIKESKEEPAVRIDEMNLKLTKESSANEWWSEPIILQAGRLYKVATEKAELDHIFWKTATSPVSSIPSSALLPDFILERCKPALIALQKAAILASNFNLNEEELRFFSAYKADFDQLDFNTLTFNGWLRLESYSELRKSLPQQKINLLDFWKWIHQTEAEEKRLMDNALDRSEQEEKRIKQLIVNKIIDLTDWKEDQINKLIQEEHFNFEKLADYRNEKNLLKLQEAIIIVNKIGVDPSLLFDWAIDDTDFSTTRKIAESIKNAMRSKYNQADWEQVIKPIHDQLRNNQRGVLISYLLQQKELRTQNVPDAEGLFEYFLIDVQMEPCMETSRIKQAISSVQLFIQRCLLGLEEHNGIKPDVLDRKRWEWMQRYRVWEANRKVYLYPENWIESNLRDDKSPFFKELESELLQKDINKENVTEALKSYLYKVDEVADMEVIGLYVDGLNNGTVWSENAKLHVFSRTRNAPYLFYYRYLALDEMNWYPWEKMQVDIPSYDVENPETQEVEDNGCYLLPLVWNNRLLIFFPQIMKKIKSNPNAEGKTYNTLGGEATETSKPIEHFEIKMGMSEYRNRKWTPKQISKDASYTFPLSNEQVIKYFKFTPIIENDKVTIGIENQSNFSENKKEVYEATFEYNGNSLLFKRKFGLIIFIPEFLKKMTQKDSSFIKAANEINTAKSLYSVKNIQDFKPYFPIIEPDLKTKEEYIHFYEKRFKNVMSDLDPSQTEFHHPHIRKLLGKVNYGKLEGFFKENLSMKSDDFGPFDHDDNSGTPSIYHELKRPYSLYNWELFFHVPMVLGETLSKSQQFEEAMKWFHYVFNPIAEGNEDNRFWQFTSFKNINSQNVLENIFNNLKPNTADKTINEWRNNPFMPHVVARSRSVAYMKWVVMKYIDNLLEWGDYLFRQDTIESINQATQLYVLASHILGPRPMMVPKRGEIEPQTYLGLLDKWDAFGNAMIELEVAAPFSNQPTMIFEALNKEIPHSNIFGSVSTLYFGIPKNPKLMSYWDTVADRLYKIRHCQNMEGVFRKLALFEPPIDPALLVKAAAQGLSIASVLNDLNTPMSNYRFYYLLQKALELCNELKSLGSSMLSAIEKKDNETIALIRAKHEGAMQNLLMEIKEKQLEEAQKNLESLIQNRKAPEARMKYYLKLSGLSEDLIPAKTADFTEIENNIATVEGDSGLKLISFEKEDMEKASEAQRLQKDIGIMEALASTLHVIPVATADAKPLGIGAGISIHGQMFGNAAQAVAKSLQLHASDVSFGSSNAGKKGSFTRALQERISQANAAGYELKQIDKQITSQEIRIDLANQEITNQQKAIDNANEVEEFIKNKYTNEELYTWMRGSLKTLYHQVYNMAYELAKKAEKTYCFERGISSANFIQSGYFDAGRDGLLAGEQLYIGLKQLEAAYQNERGHDYEITKTVSLYQISPLAVIQLRETGTCEFSLPEVLFDMDYPGHYRRRIKSTAVSIPCIAGPYTGVNATLSLLGNKFRNTALGGKKYEENVEETDDRFNSYAIPINAIAASSAQNDSGMFELDFKDERYLPFEGAGVISKWRLELPAFRQFDYRTIPDVILHLKYTANEGGDRLKSAATQSVSESLKKIKQELNETGLHMALNMKHDLPNEWVLLKKKGAVELKIDKSRLPYMAQSIKVAVEHLMLIAKVKDNPTTFAVGIGIKDGTDVEETSLERIAEWELVQGESTKIKLDEPFTLSVDAAQLNNLEELNLIVKYMF